MAYREKYRVWESVRVCGGGRDITRVCDRKGEKQC